MAGMPDAVADAVHLLQVRRQELVDEVEKIDKALFALGVEPKRPGRILSAVVEAASSLSIRDQIVNVMTEPRAYSAEEVVEAVEGNPASVRSILSRLARAGDLVSVGRGMYQKADMLPELGADDAADHDPEHEEDGG
jgi:tRNA U34 5-carboxymethylaminomethyl modifying GTPase MnmE/TrmE